ncbi:MAG: hypothetical protein M1839_008380 [Geoglossum umbratile]|nr:MAG: hypothetical protein M1839_008380 [Geoglossum umbratile]
MDYRARSLSNGMSDELSSAWPAGSPLITDAERLSPALPFPFEEPSHIASGQQYTSAQGLRSAVVGAAAPQSHFNASSGSSASYNGSSPNMLHHGSFRGIATSDLNTTNGPPSPRSFYDQDLTFSAERHYEPLFYNSFEQQFDIELQRGRIGQSIASPSPNINSASAYIDEAFGVVEAEPVCELVGRRGYSGTPPAVTGYLSDPALPRKRARRPCSILESCGMHRGTPQQCPDEQSKNCSNIKLPAPTGSPFQSWLNANPDFHRWLDTSSVDEKQMQGCELITGVPLPEIKAYFNECPSRITVETDSDHASLKTETGSGHTAIETDLLRAASLARNRARRCSATADHRQQRPRDNSRPFQCTSGCGSAFAKKDAWKKHEEINRPQNVWLCRQACCKDKPIQYRTFYTKQHFKQHFDHMHKATEVDFERYAHEWHFPVEGNFNRQCGFCGDIVHSWRGRINHVADHFSGRMPGGPSDMSQWRDPWSSGTGSQLADNGEDTSDNGDPPDEPPDDRPSGPSNSRPGGPPGGPGTGGGKNTGQGDQGKGDRPSQESRKRHERHSRDGWDRGQQRYHGMEAISIRHNGAGMLLKNVLGEDELRLYCIGAWAPATNLEGRRSDLRTSFKRRDRVLHLLDVDTVDEGKAITRQVAHSISPRVPRPTRADSSKPTPPATTSALERQSNSNANHDANDPSEPTYMFGSPVLAYELSSSSGPVDELYVAAEADVTANQLTKYTPRRTYSRSPFSMQRWLEEPRQIPRSLVNPVQLDPSILTAGRESPTFTSTHKAETGIQDAEH